MSRRSVMALKAKPSPRPLPTSTCLPSLYRETGEVRAASTATPFSKGALDPHSPLHHKEGVLHGHGARAPGRLSCSAHRALSPSWPSSVHSLASCVLARRTLSSERALRPGCPDGHCSSSRSAPRAKSQTREPAPAAVSSLRDRRSDPAPWALDCSQSQTRVLAPLPHWC